jgi:hypothetical protein
MFEQYNIIQKIFRIIIFIILTLFAILISVNKKLDNEDKCKLILLMTIIFVIYDFYYPSVKIELKD